MRSKNGVFAVYYFGNGHTLHTRVGIQEEIANAAYEAIMRDFPDFAKARSRVINMFLTLSQPGGIGTAVEWTKPADYIESVLGFRRYFILENMIVKALYDLGCNPPKEWLKINIKVTRSDRVQTAIGALRSALFGSAFGLQGAVMRAAGNHLIQSPGAQITKGCQRAIWNLQPIGINKWLVQPLNVHDEVMCVTRPELSDKVKETVDTYNGDLKRIVPLLFMEWKQKIKTWADK